MEPVLCCILLHNKHDGSRNLFSAKEMLSELSAALALPVATVMPVP